MHKNGTFICVCHFFCVILQPKNVITNTMPKIFEYFGFVFFFYSNEHEPIHVHVSRGRTVVIQGSKDSRGIYSEI